MAKGAFEIRGTKELIERFKKLGNPREMKKILRKTVNNAANPVVKAVREAWPKDTGFSAKSVTKKIVAGNTGYTAVIGVDKAAQTEVAGHLHVPSNIDHLVELGYTLPDGTVVPAKAPLRRGFEASGAVAEAQFTSKMGAEVDKAALKGL
jgi:hypothetical protein